MASSATLTNSNEHQSFPIGNLSILINVSNFVSSKLRGDRKTNNYSSWKEQMLCLIESQDLLEFILDDGKSHSNDHIIRRTDRLVKGWILGALDDNVLKTAVEFNTARDVWVELENMFSDTDQLHLQQAEGPEWHDHLQLYKAALTGDWSKAKAILEQNPNALETKLNPTLQTTLHIAVGTGEAFDFVKELVVLMPNNLLGLKDYLGFTALHVAAQTGNTKAAKILVDKRPDLLQELSEAGELSGHVKTLNYFIFEANDDSPYLNETSGVKLLCMLIDASIFADVALHLAEKYPYLATVKLKDGNCALKRIALKRDAFPRDRIFRWFYIDREDRTTPKTADIEGSVHPENSYRDSSTWFKSLYERLHYMAFAVMSVVYYTGWYNPYGIWNLGRGKQRREQAIKLVKCLCKNMESLDYCSSSAIYEDAILTAARLGIHEIVEEIEATFPASIYARDIYTKQSIFHLAAENHHRRVFGLIRKRRNIKHQLSDMRDVYGNTILHSAARLESPYNSALGFRIRGAALQMQRELRWFYEIANFVPPHSRGNTNRDGKTAWMVFLEEHAALKEQVDLWIKDTSQACSIVAALIATVTFAAAITMPGGLDSSTKHLPFFSDQTPFKAFTWFTIISFLTSITSLFLFLSTNIHLYTKEIVLPVPTISNLFILFISVMSMMGAFISAIYLLLKDQNTVIVFSILLLYVLIPSYGFLIVYVPLVSNLVKYLSLVQDR